MNSNTKKILRFYLLLFFLSILPATLYPTRFEHLMVENGLAHTDAVAIVQDNTGLIWIGTNSGLQSYDGYNINLYDYYNNYDSKVRKYHNRITAMSIDDENLWLGTKSGLLCFSLHKHIFAPVKSTNNSSILTHDIKAVFSDNNGKIWVKTVHNFYVCTYDKENCNIVVTDSIPSSYPVNSGADIHTILCVKKNIWLITQQHLLKINQKDNKIVIERIISSDELLPTGQIIVSATKSNEYLYLRTEEGCVRVNLNKNNGDFIFSTKKYIQFDKIISNIPRKTTGKIAVDKNGTLWVITQNGLVEIKKPYLTPVGKLHSKVLSDPNSLSTNFLSSLMIDTENNLWVGTWGGGVNYLSNQESFFKLIKYTPDSKFTIYDQFVKAIETDVDGTLWILTQKGGLNHYDKKNGLISNHSFNELPFTNRVYKDVVFSPDKKSLLVGTMEGLILFDKTTKKSSVLIGRNNGSLMNKNIHIYSLDTDNFGNVWIGTWDAGLICLRQNKDVFELITTYNNSGQDKISSNLISFVYCDRDKNEVFVCTDNGLNRLIQNKNGNVQKIITYKSNEKSKNTITNDFISVIDKQNDSIYWIGTLGGGLVKLEIEDYSTNYNATSYLLKDGLSSDNVEIVLVDRIGNVWFSGNGISKLDTKTNSISYYDYRDGLQGNSFKIGAGHKDIDGTLFFGGIYGLNYFNPINITSTEIKNNLILSNLYIHSKLIEPGDINEGRVVLKNALNHTPVLRLKYNENDFSISFSALNYWTTSQIKYRYRLKGLNSEWQILNGDEYRVNYSNLDYNKYTFQLQVSSNGGKNWSGFVKSMEIIIMPPWWLSLYAKLLYLIVIVLIVYVVFRFYSREIEMKHELKLKDLEEQKMEQNHQLKLQFFTNISHEFKTPLTLILSSIETIEHNEELKNFPKDIFDVVSRNAHKMLMLINELMDFRKTDIKKDVIHLTFGNVTRYIEQIKREFDTCAAKKDIKINLISENVEMYFDNEKFAKIFSNLFSNALKYSNVGMDIEIIIKKGFIKDISYQYEEKFIASGNTITDECCLIFVRDKGVGISKESISQIFDRFYQVDSKTAMHLGSGIGLAVAKNMVLSHKGIIIVDSQRNVGTEFIVAIPLNLHPKDEIVSSNSVFDLNQFIEDQHLEFNYDSHSLAQNSNDIEKNEKPTLLIVEDNLELLLSLKQYFLPDYNVLIAENGKIGLELCKNEFPDLVISDVMMPEMDGIELCSEIRESLNIAYTPIILLTAKSDVEHHLKGYEVGADLYLPKPFSLRLLAVNVKRLIALKLEMLSINNCSESNEEMSGLLSRNDIINKKEKEFITKLIELVNLNLDNTDYSVEQLCRDLGVGRTKLYTKVKDNTGQALGDLIRDIRLNKAAHLLRTTDMNVTEVIYEVGFGTNSHFSKAFKTRFGMTPTEYSKSNS